MARIARVVVPGYPHHVTQRGNRKQRTFFSEGDYEAYISLMSQWCRERGVEIWAYCLMPNHVHLVAVPESEDSLRRAIGEAHRRYTLRVNERRGWQGHLWQGRFTSFVMDEAYLLAAARYIERNPVLARLCRRPEDYRWSSARAHVAGRDDALVKVRPLLEIANDWQAFLSDGKSDGGTGRILRRHEATGRPLGAEGFVLKLEKLLARRLRPLKRGPKGPRKNN